MKPAESTQTDAAAWRRRKHAAVLLGALGTAVWLASLYPSAAPAQSPDPEYAAPDACAVCHRGIWETYRRTGMGRSFYRPAPETTLERDAPATFYHQASDSYFTMLRRDNK